MFWPSSKNRCIADRFINPDGSWPKGYLTVKRSPENASILLVNEVKLNLSNYWEFGSAN